MLFTTALPIFAGAALLALFIRRRQVAKAIGRDPIVLEAFEATDTPSGWLQSMLGFGGLLLLVDIALNALTTETIETKFAIPLLRSSSILRAIGVVALIAGAALAGAAIVSMRSSWRIGIDRQTGGPLVVTGLFSRLRHPIYSGLLLIVIGLACVTADAISIAVAAAGAVGIPLQARLEEAFLLSKHGEEYRRYMERTARFWPRVG